MQTLKRFLKNDFGRDYVVGDIHGCFTDLQNALEKIEFNQETDRLFSVGDLVDRGPESHLAIEWLAKPWFHPVRGNHDDFVCTYEKMDHSFWCRNGGAWFYSLSSSEQKEFAVQFREIPIAIQVETEAGLVGIIHADVPSDDWSQLELAVQVYGTSYAMWSRDRITEQDCDFVDGVRMVFVGHTPVKAATILGNVCHIDTGAVFKSRGGYFTIIDIATNEIKWCGA